jgi:guanine deaminase
VRTLYRASLFTPLPDGPPQRLEDAHLLVEDGAIASVGEWRRAPRVEEVEDLRPLTLVPGFVDCHLHLTQFPIRGLHGLPLLEWLRRYVFPFEARFGDPAFARSEMERALHSLLASGVTTIAAYVTSHPETADIAFERAEAAGIRAVIGLPLMDRNVPPSLRVPGERALAEARRLIERWHGRAGRLHFAVTPRFALSCSPELLRGAGDLARETGAYVQTHLSEQQPEIDAILQAFPEAGDGTAVLEDAGLLGERTLLAHCIHLSEDEALRLAKAGARPVHCPTSNRVLGSGVMPLGRFREIGLTVGLGSDVGAGPEWNPFLVAREAALLQDLSVEDAWTLATREGGRALGLPVGCLARGFRADFLALAPVEEAGPGPEERLSQWIYCGGPEQVRRVHVDGKLVHLKEGD